MSVFVRKLSKLFKKMDLPSEDLEEYVEKFENLFTNQKYNKKNQNELLLLIENMSAELGRSRKSENILRSNLKKIIECENININKKYVKLEEKCNALYIENTRLLREKEELNIVMQNKLESQNNDYLKKIRDMEEKSLLDITNLKNQLESNRICHEAKERELYNELQLVQAATSLEWDEKETNLQRQLSDARNNFSQCQTTIRHLKYEINQLKNQLSLQKSSTQNNILYFRETPIQQMKNKLFQERYDTGFNNSESFGYNQNQVLSENFNTALNAVDDNLLCENNTQDKFKENLNESNISNLKSVTRPLSLSSSSSTIVNDQHHQSNPRDHQSLVKETNLPQDNEIYVKSVVKKRNTTKNYLPSLIACSSVNNPHKDSKEKKIAAQHKKRKLYNPDDPGVIMN